MERQKSTATITPGEKPGTGTCSITLADGTVISGITSKQEAFEHIVQLGNENKIDIRDWQVMRDTILKSTDLPWHGVEANSFAEVIRVLSLLVDTLEKEHEAPECAAVPHNDLAGAILEMCPCGRKHGRIYCKGGYKTSLLESRGEAFFYLEKLRKEFVSDHEYDVVKKQIEEADLPPSARMHFDFAAKEMHIVFADGKESLAYSTKVEACNALIECWALGKIRAVEVLELVYEVITTEGFEYSPKKARPAPKAEVINLFAPNGEPGVDQLILMAFDKPKEQLTEPTVLMYKNKGYARIMYMNKANELCSSLPIRTRAYGFENIVLMRNDADFPLDEKDLDRLAEMVRNLDLPEN